MARRKPGTSMKSHTIRMTDEEWAEMQRCAEIADESDSEYIRKAIKEKNFMMKAISEQVTAQHNYKVTGNEIKESRETFLEKGKQLPNIAKELTEIQAKQKENLKNIEVKNNNLVKSPMVNAFMKGEKK